jgi:hypothetical protein
MPEKMPKLPCQPKAMPHPFKAGGNMKSVFRLAIAAFGLAAFNLSTTVAQGEDYIYTINNGTITITGYTGPGGALAVPSTINSLPVTAIGDGAFDWCTSLTSVTIPDTVISIGVGAFDDCASLTNILIPNSVTSIGDYAFDDCYLLRSFSFPQSVTSIGESRTPDIEP